MRLLYKQSEYNNIVYTKCSVLIKFFWSICLGISRIFWKISFRWCGVDFSKFNSSHSLDWLRERTFMFNYLREDNYYNSVHTVWHINQNTAYSNSEALTSKFIEKNKCFLGTSCIVKYLTDINIWLNDKHEYLVYSAKSNITIQ